MIFTKKPVILVIMLAFLMIIASLAGCSQAPAPQTQAPIKLGLLPIEENLPLYVAEQEKMFDKAGVKVELINFPSAQEMMAAIQAGQIDGEITDLVVSHLLKKGGTDIRIAAISLGNKPEEGRFAVLSSPNSSIRKIEDLKNVGIGGTENTIIHYVVDNLLIKTGFKAEEIKITSIPKFPVRLDMLLNNQIQAAVFTDPLASFAELQGAHLIVDDTKEDISQTVILFRKDTLDKNLSGVKSVLSVYEQAGQEITNNPEKYKDLIHQKAQVPEPLKKTYKIPSYSKLQRPTEQQINKVAEWMVNKKLLTAPIPYNEIVDITLLSAK